MTIYNILSKNIVLRFADFYTNWNVAKSLGFLKKSQHWSREDILEFQNKRLSQLINYAYNEVPYYHELFRQNNITPNDIRGINDLKYLPILTKEKLVENFNAGKFGLKKNNYIFNQSSGSTGLKTQYFITPEAYGFNLATNLRGWSWMGYEIGDKIIKVTQNERSTKLKKIQDNLNRTKLFTADYNLDSTKEFFNLIQDFKPEFVRCYPDPLVFFANNFSKIKPFDFRLRAINTTGNILFPEARELIKNVFKCEVFDSYSCDNGPNAFECSSHSCYHNSDEQGIVEILDENGKQLKKEGEIGRLIITNLVNYATPFIRYDTKDFVELGPAKCECGRELTTFKRIIGRDNDIVILEEGEILIAQSFTTYFKHFEDIKQFQVIQKSHNHLIFKLVVAEKFNVDLKAKIIDNWVDRLKNKVRIEIIIVNDISPLTSGKFRFVNREF